jgi:DinB family protein
MHPQLAPLLDQLTAATARARALGSRLDDVAFHARPPAGGWSPAECAAHLSLTTVAFLPRLDAALAAGRPGTSDTHAYRRGFLGALLAWSMEPPVRVRFRTRAGFVPTSDGSRNAILAEFERLQRELGSRIERASGLDLNVLRVGSPFGKVSYNVYGAFCIIMAHERRHLWQAERAARPL